MNPVHETEPCILVEGPKWADAEFYGKWLLMATKAQALWEKAIKDTRFEKQIDLLTVIYIPQFDHSASLFLFQLKKNLVSFTIPLHNSEDWAELDQFTLMAEMGFFVLTDGRYQMAIPAKLNMDVVKSAALRFAKTEDEDEAYIQNTSSPRCHTRRLRNGKHAYVTWMRNNGAPTGPSCSISILQNS